MMYSEVRPDFFIVGAPKCGTTAMDSFLSQHPDIFIPEAKELQFFGSDIQMKETFVRSKERFNVNQDSYRSYFDGVRDEKRIGESTVWYLYSKLAAEEIKAYNPQANIIIMLRNPVDMMYSLHRQYLYDLNEDIEDFAEALDAESARKEGGTIPNESFWRDALYYRELASFTEQVERYIQTFGREKVHFILFDEIQRDISGTYRKLLNFLQIDPDFEANFSTVNPSKTFRNKWLHELSVNPPKWFQVMIAPLLRNSAIRSALKATVKAVNTKKQSYPPIDPHLRQQLLGEFAQEIEALGKLIQRDLSGWMLNQDE